jgi:hypothetical protein
MAWIPLISSALSFGAYARYISISASSTDLSPTVALGDRCLKGLAPQLRNPEIHFPGVGGIPSFTFTPHCRVCSPVTAADCQTSLPRLTIR